MSSGTIGVNCFLIFSSSAAIAASIKGIRNSLRDFLLCAAAVLARVLMPSSIYIVILGLGFLMAL